MPLQRDPSEPPGYVGALLERERRLVLVPLDPERPWAAFRRLRSWMKRSQPRPTSATMELFRALDEAAAKGNSRRGGAEVIAFRPRNARS